MREERYSQDEVAAILKRSAEIEGERLRNPPAEELSLSDLEEIAEESGLDPASVRAAARELAAAPELANPEGRSQPPSAAQLHYRRNLDGELDDANLERLVESTGNRLNLTGQTTRDGQGWLWSERWGRRRLRVKAESRNGRTTLEIDEDLRSLGRKLTGGLMSAVGSFGFAFGFAFGMNVENSLAGALIFAGLMGTVALAGSFGVSQLMFGRYRMARDLQLQRLAGELEQAGRAALARTRTAEEPRPGETEAAASPARWQRERPEDEDGERDARGPTSSRSRD